MPPAPCHNTPGAFSPVQASSGYPTARSARGWSITAATIIGDRTTHGHWSHKRQQALLAGRAHLYLIKLDLFATSQSHTDYPIRLPAVHYHTIMQSFDVPKSSRRLCAQQVRRSRAPLPVPLSTTLCMSLSSCHRGLTEVILSASVTIAFLHASFASFDSRLTCRMQTFIMCIGSPGHTPHQEHSILV